MNGYSWPPVFHGFEMSFLMILWMAPRIIFPHSSPTHLTTINLPQLTISCSRILARSISIGNYNNPFFSSTWKTPTQRDQSNQTSTNAVGTYQKSTLSAKPMWKDVRKRAIAREIAPLADIFANLTSTLKNGWSRGLGEGEHWKIEIGGLEMCSGLARGNFLTGHWC